MHSVLSLKPGVIDQTLHHLKPYILYVKKKFKKKHIQKPGHIAGVLYLPILVKADSTESRN